MKINKKGYFYTLDASIGVLLLIVSLVIILGYYYFAPDREQTDAISHETISVLASTKVIDYCITIVPGSCSCTYTSLTNACNAAKNTDVSMLSLIAQLYYLEERDHIENVIDEIFIQTGVHPNQYGLKILLTDPVTRKEIQLYPVVIV